MTPAPLLEVQDVRVYYKTSGTLNRAVDGVSLTLNRGDCLGVVGESGCGKSTLGRAILQLEPIHSGQVLFQGESITQFTAERLKAFRRKAQMVFQDPYGSLNPRLSIGGAIEEVLKVHRLCEKNRRRARVSELLESVGLPASYADRYPHEFSGGQRQRIGIARALAVEPELIIADEPVSALDVSVQVQILNLLKDLKQRLNLTYLFVAHDLAVVRYLCPRVVVMYLGKLVETGDSEKVYQSPAHPYTQALLAAVPDVERALSARGTPRTSTMLRGDLSPAQAVVEGCAFHPRCPHAADVCRRQSPVLREVAPGHFCACHFAEQKDLTGR